MRQIETPDGRTWRLEQWHFTQKTALSGTTVLLFWDMENDEVRIALIDLPGLPSATDEKILEAYGRSIPPADPSN